MEQKILFCSTLKITAIHPQSHEAAHWNGYYQKQSLSIRGSDLWEDRTHGERGRRISFSKKPAKLFCVCLKH